MMLTLILLIGLVYWIGTTFGDSAGAVALWLLILFLVILFCRGWSESTRAVGNWIRYWSRGEPPEREVKR